jgi:hypothetical protein
MSQSSHPSPRSPARFRTPLDFVDRRDTRLVFSFASLMSLSDCGDITLRVLNFSEAGFMAECSEKLSVGTSMQIKLPRQGMVAGHILWSRAGRIGCAFAARINVDQLVQDLETLELSSAS